MEADLRGLLLLKTIKGSKVLWQLDPANCPCPLPDHLVLRERAQTAEQIVPGGLEGGSKFESPNRTSFWEGMGRGGKERSREGKEEKHWETHPLEWTLLGRSSDLDQSFRWKCGRVDLFAALCLQVSTARQQLVGAWDEVKDQLSPVKIPEPSKWFHTRPLTPATDTWGSSSVRLSWILSGHCILTQ